MCCEGHGIPNMSLFWVEFSRSVQKNDILNFMADHSHLWVDSFGEVRKSFVCNGWFTKCMWPKFSTMTMKSRWRYFVGNSEAADLDVADWEMIDSGKILWNGPSFVRLKDHEEAMRRKQR